MGSHQWQSAAALESLVRAFVVLSQLVPEPTRGTYTLVLGWLAKGAQQLQEHQKEEKEWKGRDEDGGGRWPKGVFPFPLKHSSFYSHCASLESRFTLVRAKNRSCWT